MKRTLLAAYLECDPDELDQANFDQNLFEFGLESYLVLTDDEANEYARQQVLDTLFAFNAEFILPRTRIEVDENEGEVLGALKSMQGKLYERANPIIKALINDVEQFVEDAIAADGRGHFLAQYDKKQIEVSCGDETFYIYRQN